MDYTNVAAATAELLKLTPGTDQNTVITAGQRWMQHAEEHIIKVLIAERTLRHSLWFLENSTSLEEIAERFAVMRTAAGAYAELLGVEQPG